jgi:N-acetylglucosaminyldiphosphoundecaprenol N-acetyl-beta-D-mannosaminyltransferase
MTAPKQEKWVYKNRNRINAGTICSVGAVFDFYAGHIHRPSRWLIRHNLEWLGRLFMSPKRVWRRIFFSTPVFVSHINKLRRTPKD